MSHIKLQVCRVLNICWVRLPCCVHELIKIARTQKKAMWRPEKGGARMQPAALLQMESSHKHTECLRDRQVSKDWIKMVFKYSCVNAVHIKKFLETSDLKYALTFLLCGWQVAVFSGRKHKTTFPTTAQHQTAGRWSQRLPGELNEGITRCGKQLFVVKKLYKSSVVYTTGSTKHQNTAGN